MTALALHQRESALAVAVVVPVPDGVPSAMPASPDPPAPAEVAEVPVDVEVPVAGAVLVVPLTLGVLGTLAWVVAPPFATSLVASSGSPHPAALAKSMAPQSSQRVAGPGFVRLTFFI
jgi:hypothetical protein